VPNPPDPISPYKPISMKIHTANQIPLKRGESSPAHGAGSSMLHAWWLGQAGFLFESCGLRMLIDPYLSDFLAQKYKGKKYPHTRMSPPPVQAEELFDIDFVLATHGHSDHLDPGSIPVMARNNPSCRFVVPESCQAAALERGVPADRLLTVNAGDNITLGGGAILSMIPAAHEQLERDTAGHYLHLGYVFDFAGLNVWHSGDCCPYPGLEESLVNFKVDVAFLPVNGRDKERTGNGIIGNFRLDEALDLVLTVPIALGVGHHFGLFDFNTIAPEEARQYLSTRPEAEGRFLLAEPGTMYEFSSQRMGT